MLFVRLCVCVCVLFCVLCAECDLINNKKEKVFKTFNFFRKFFRIRKAYCRYLKGQTKLFGIFSGAVFVQGILSGLDNFLNCFLSRIYSVKLLTTTGSFLRVCYAKVVLYIPLLFFWMAQNFLSNWLIRKSKMDRLKNFSYQCAVLNIPTVI